MGVVILLLPNGSTQCHTRYLHDFIFVNHHNTYNGDHYKQKTHEPYYSGVLHSKMDNVNNFVQF